VSPFALGTMDTKYAASSLAKVTPFPP